MLGYVLPLNHLDDKKDVVVLLLSGIGTNKVKNELTDPQHTLHHSHFFYITAQGAI